MMCFPVFRKWKILVESYELLTCATMEVVFPFMNKRISSSTSMNMEERLCIRRAVEAKLNSDIIRYVGGVSFRSENKEETNEKFVEFLRKSGSLVNFSKMTKLDIMLPNIEINPGVLSPLITDVLEELTLRQVSNVDGVLDIVAKADSIKLKKLILNTDVTKSDAEKLAQALCRIECVSIFSLTDEQQHLLFDSIANNNVKLKSLDISKEVDGGVIAQALHKLSEVSLTLDGENQTHTFFQTIALGNEESKLQKLNIHGFNIFDVEANVLVEAVCKLNEVIFHDDLNQDQIEKLFGRISNGENVNVKCLSIHDHSEFDTLNVDVLSRSVKNLNVLELALDYDEHVNAILQAISNSDEVKLSKLSLKSTSCLEGLDENMLIRAVTKIKEVKFPKTPLPLKYQELIFKTIVDTEIKSLTLESLGMYFVNTDPNLLAEAAIKLVRLNIYIEGDEDDFDYLPQTLAVLDRVYSESDIRLEYLGMEHLRYKDQFEYPSSKMEVIRRKLRKFSGPKKRSGVV